MRVGIGYDVHPFGPGQDVTLGGVKIPYERSLVGHSDADVLVHAVMDAILGALGLPDIGVQFPDSDPAYRGIASLLLLERVRALADEKQYFVGNIDSTIIAEAPRVSPHYQVMKANIARVLGISAEDVGIKATTNERLGFVGRREGIAAMAVALVDKR